MIIVLLVPVGGGLYDRLSTVSTVWSQGTGVGRIHLMQQALFQLSKFPLFGVGLNRFTEIMSAQDLPIEIRNFLFPVHNTFLLFFSETGIPGGLLFAMFAFAMLGATLARAKKSLISYGVWLGAATFVVNAQFHTLFHQDPSLDFFMVLLAYLSVL